MTKSQYKILLIDDNPEGRALIRRHLEHDPNYDYRIWEEEQGEKGLVTRRAILPDCILLDYKLPDLNGLEFLARLRKESSSPPFAVVLPLNEGNEAVGMEALKRGAQDYLVKGQITVERVRQVTLGAIKRAASLHQLEVRQLELADAYQREQERRVNTEAAWDRLNAILGSITDAFFTLDQQWCFTYFNRHAERLLGKTREEVLGKQLWEQFPEIIDSAFAQHYYRARTEQTTVEFEERYPRSQTWVEVHIFPTRDGLSVYVRNITARKQLEARLRERERLAILGTTAVNLTHEIGNRLNGISTTIQLLERYRPQQHAFDGDPLVGDSLTEIVSDLKAETNRMQSLLQDIRTLTNLHQLNFRPINVTAVVAEVLQNLTRDYAERGIHVEQIFPTQLPLVMADWEKLSQIVLKLCNNAAEVMPFGGTLTIRGTVAEGQVRLEIQDTGEGIPEIIDIFEPFVTTKPGYTGLGLAVVKQLVAAHNGMITYTNIPGQGTTFTLTLIDASLDIVKNTPTAPRTTRPTPHQSDPADRQSRRASQ